MDASTPAELLAEHRAAIEAQLIELTAELDRLAAATEMSNHDDEHDPEGATVGFERAQLSALLDRTREHLKELDAADRRLAAGTYGRCEGCTEPIGDERLRALPAARLCVRCAGKAARR
ncbi:MAG TPA: TraR/DksA C4-type zinc finger protein [Jatrophihabitans sp.]|nr:TraR/DksA C4-type zinc finger protein [Jatrophihabitans sp.]